MEIRKCTAADLASVGLFYDKVVSYLDDYPKWVYKVYPSEASARGTIANGHQFVCCEGEQILGAFVLNDDPQGAYDNADWSTSLSQGEYMVCHTLASDPSLQGRGIGMQMVEYCIRYAKEHGYQAIRLDVVPDNVPARKLYEKCGFRYVGDVDLERDIPEIPVFSMYELNF